MGREAKFNFIPAHQVSKLFADDREFKVTLRTKGAMMISFPSNHPETKNLVGKYLQFFVDTEKNTLAWKVFEHGTFTDLMECMPVRSNKTTGESFTINVSCSIALRNLTFEKDVIYKKLPVEKYGQQGMLNDGKKFYYITVPKKAQEK